MKKLMIAAVTAAVAGGAFATPLVYEYKASLKNMNLKEVKVTYDKVQYLVYMKYQKNTSLKGWLIMDQDGVTSPTIMTDRLGLEADPAHPYGTGYFSPSTGFDYGRNRGFLVVINPNAYKAVRRPKILPAILDAKWIDTAFTKKHAAQTGPAEGYLYVGGDAVKPVRPQLDYLDSLADIPDVEDHAQRSITNEPPVIGAQVPYVPAVAATDDSATGDQGTAGDTSSSSGVATNYSGMVAIADYVWTSVYLFAGSTEKDAYFNGPNWFSFNGVSPFGMFEFAWDQNLPPLLQTGWMTNSIGAAKKPVNYYHDTWMNGSGVAGKWSKAKEDGEQCCGIIEDLSYDRPILETLSGNLKGGLFLCTENGIDAKSKNYSWWDGIAWEDQFTTARLEKSDLFADDSWQNDLWQDGFFEIETTDVITGTWSIKRANSKFFAKKNPIYSELDAKFVNDYIKRYTIGWIPATTETQVMMPQLDDQGNPVLDQETGLPVLEPKTIAWSVSAGKDQFAYDPWLWGSINGAAYDLAKKNGGSYTLFDGTEIYSKASNKRSDIPVVTPQFALYYRLVWGEYDVADLQQGDTNP